MWHATHDIDTIADRICIEPTTWRTDGQIVTEGAPPAIGNAWIATASGGESVKELTGQLRPHQAAFLSLIDDGARAHITIHFQPVAEGAIPNIPFSQLQLLVALRIDILFLHERPTSRST